MRKVVPTPPPQEALIADTAAFGAILRAARTGAGMTLADAAMAFGIAKQTLADLETAKSSVGLATALKVAAGLGVAVFAVPAADREPVRRLIVGARRSADATNPDPQASDKGARKGAG